MVSARDALERLREGNRRFVEGHVVRRPDITHARRAELAEGQRPIAIILGCSDSRVPIELVFDQGLGDLFVIRVAGNIVAPSGVGSIEFAATEFGTRLVVVLGHTRCGAITATLKELRQPAGSTSQNLSSIVDRVRPAVEPLLAGGGTDDPDGLLNAAVRANVEASVEQIRAGSEILAQMLRTDGLMIVGARYCLDTGVVDFFDDD